MSDFKAEECKKIFEEIAPALSKHISDGFEAYEKLQRVKIALAANENPEVRKLLEGLVQKR